MSDVQKGYSFSGTSPNNLVTAEKLNTLVDEATILPGFYTEKAELFTTADEDLLLVYDASAAAYRKVKKLNLIAGATTTSGSVNLQLTSLDGTLVGVKADEVALRNDTGGARRITQVDTVASLAVYSAGPTSGGRDFATVPSNSWAYVWAISDGVNDRAMLSLSATAPTMPDGTPLYQYKALLGAVRINNSGALVKQVQRGNHVALRMPSVAGAVEATANPKTGGVEFTEVAPAVVRQFQPVDLSACVPPNLTARVQGLLGHTGTGVGHCMYAVAAQAVGTLDALTQQYGLQVLHALALGSATWGFYGVASFDVVLRTSQQVDWTSSSANAKHNLRITGYTLAL